MVRVASNKLRSHFWLMPEARLRHVCSHTSLRIDLLAWPRFDRFPFEIIGIEVKRATLGDGGFTEYTQALKQCADYQHSVIAHERCKRSGGWRVGAAFLYYGAGADDGWHAGAVRAVGKLNVGELINHPHDGFRLEISTTPIWNGRKGVTGTGRCWPRQRRVGNSKARA